MANLSLKIDIKTKPHMDFVFRKSTKSNMKNYGSLQARFRSNGTAKYCSLGITLKESEWNKFRSNKWSPSNLLTSLGIKYGDFASMLAEIKNVPEGDFQPKKIKKLIEKIICESKEIGDEEKHLIINKDELLLSEYMLKYIEDMEAGKRLKKQESISVSKSYIQVIKNARSVLLKYEEVCEKHFLLCDIDSTFRNGYIKWLSDTGKSANYISSLMRSIYTLLRNAFEDGLTKNDYFMKKGFVPSPQQTDAVYLSPKKMKIWIEFDMTYTESLKKDFEAVINKDLEKGKRPHRFSERYCKNLETARDIFIVGCYTGQRISDYRRINKDMIVDINGKKFISLIQQKTKKKVIIPLDKKVKRILDKYNGSLPKISEFTFNKDIRLIAEVLGWTENPLFDKAKADGNKEERFCDLITSHTARRTFATNAYSYGVPLASIMAVTGHSTEEKLRIYLHLQAEDKALLAAKDLDGFLRLKKKGTNNIQDIDDSENPQRNEDSNDTNSDEEIL